MIDPETQLAFNQGFYSAPDRTALLIASIRSAGVPLSRYELYARWASLSHSTFVSLVFETFCMQEGLGEDWAEKFVTEVQRDLRTNAQTLEEYAHDMAMAILMTIQKNTSESEQTEPPHEPAKKFTVEMMQDIINRGAEIARLIEKQKKQK